MEKLSPAYTSQLLRALSTPSKSESYTGGTLVKLARKLMPVLDRVVIVATTLYIFLLGFSTAPNASASATMAYSYLRAPFAITYTFELLVRLIARGPFSTPRRGRPMFYYVIEIMFDIFVVVAPRPLLQLQRCR